MVRRFSVLLVTTALFSTAALSHAENRGVSSAPVYVIDMQKVVATSRAGREAQGKLERDLKERKGQLQQMRTALQAQQEDVRKQAGILSEEALESRIEGLRKKERELGEATEDFRAEFGRRNGALVTKIVKEVNEILADLSKNQGYRFIIEKNDGSVIYSDEQLDLSDKVIKILDGKKITL